ncbi:hypothetical protein NFI96_012474, partial [Prochilodus magdalenae]
DRPAEVGEQYISPPTFISLSFIDLLGLIDELDTLLSFFPVDGSPLLLLGNFNLPSDKLQSSRLKPLLSSFDLNPSLPPHRGGNTLDLIFRRPTPALDITTTSNTYWNPATQRPAHWIPSHPYCSSQSISLDLLPFISLLINGSLSSGHVPQTFKIARVVPILKKSLSDPTDISRHHFFLFSQKFLNVQFVINSPSFSPRTSFRTSTSSTSNRHIPLKLR